MAILPSVRPSSPPVARVTHRGRAVRVSDVTCRAGRHDRPYDETHAAFCVALVRRGSFSYRDRATRRLYHLREGWLLLGRPGRVFACSHEHDGGDDCISLELDAAVVDDVARHTPGARGPLFESAVLPPSPRVSAWVAALGQGADADVDEVGHAVVHAALQRTPRASASPSRTDRDRVMAALSIIEARTTETLALADLAAAVGLSPFHFLRIFRRTTGITPHRYLVDVRLRRATSLLTDTSRPVTDIAYDAGFGDLSNFVRTFHREIGCSPGAYRRGLRPPATPAATSDESRRSGLRIHPARTKRTHAREV
jgi:AraC family transcriptional regulator